MFVGSHAYGGGRYGGHSGDSLGAGRFMSGFFGEQNSE